MTAIARLIILQGKEMDAPVLIYEASAIAIIALACLIIRFKPLDLQHASRRRGIMNCKMTVNERYYDWMLWKMREENGTIYNKLSDGYSTDWQQYEMNFKFKEDITKRDLNKEKELFCITPEECGELVQVRMKIARWGVEKKKLQS